MRPSMIALLLLGGAGCSFDGGGVAGDGADAFDPGDDGGGVPNAWRDDSRDDFSLGAPVDGAVVEAWGAVGPAAWLTGGLRARSSDSQLFTDPGAATWATLDATTPVGVALSELPPSPYLADRPRGLGLTTSDTFTVWFDGEIWLEQGLHRWSLTVDDGGFIELAAPGTDSFTRVIAAVANVPGQATYQATATGWHPVRIAFAENLLDAELSILLQPPGAPALDIVSRDRLRFRADALTGLHWLGFDDALLNGPRLGPFLFAIDAFDYDPQSGDLTALGLKSADQFAMRWAGQFRVDVAGSYSFRLITDDGQRMWIDGAPLLDFWNGSSQEHVTAAVELEVGWHDLVVDLGNDTGGQRVRLSVESGPELVGDELPLARLRPVAPRHERTSVGTGPPTPIDDEATIEVEVKIAAPPTATAIAMEVAYTIDHSGWEDLTIKLVSPDGAEAVLLDDVAPRGGSFTERHTVAVPGAPVSGPWKLVVTDGLALDSGTVTALSMTARYRGGEPPIAPAAIYQSAIEELGTVVGFDHVSWAGRLPVGSSVAVRLRTCDTIGGCAAEPWSEPVTTSGERPSVLARRFAQYQIELRSDGDVAPWLDWIEIGYRRAR